jgi:thiol-disulfide isomerase/thioredoxin
MSNNPNLDFEEALKTQKKMFVLFYASWCFHSRKFLPIYQKCALNAPVPCLRVMIDDREDLCDKYDINYYPTVLLFEDGKVLRRLDPEPGGDLTEKQMRDLLNSS